MKTALFVDGIEKVIEVTNKQTFKPGTISPFSGEAELIGSRGGHTGHEVTVDRGERFPPTPEPGQKYIPSRRAHNKAGYGR